MRSILNRLLRFILYFLTIWPSAICGRHVRSFALPMFGMHIGSSVFIDEFVTLFPPSNINIGSGSSILSSCAIYANDGKVSIGANCAFNRNVMIDGSQGSVSVGDDVLIGPNTVIRSSDHNFASKYTPIRKQGHKAGDIWIGDDCWIGANVTILSNVKVAKGCVVGAGSVVTKDLPPGWVCFDKPAAPKYQCK